MSFSWTVCRSPQRCTEFCPQCKRTRFTIGWKKCLAAWRPLDVLGTDGIVDLIEVYTSWKQLYFHEVGPQYKEYLLQPVSGGGEGVTIIPGIRVNADVAEDIQRVIYPFTGVNVFPQSRHQYRCIWLPVCPKRLMRYD